MELKSGSGRGVCMGGRSRGVWGCGEGGSGDPTVVGVHFHRVIDALYSQYHLPHATRLGIKSQHELVVGKTDKKKLSNFLKEL